MKENASLRFLIQNFFQGSMPPDPLGIWPLWGQATWSLAMCKHVTGTNLSAMAAANSTENPAGKCREHIKQDGHLWISP